MLGGGGYEVNGKVAGSIVRGGNGEMKDIKYDKNWYGTRNITAEWVKAAYSYLIKANRFNYEGIYNLTKLTWITKSKGKLSLRQYENLIKPALAYIFNIGPEDQFEIKLQEVAGVDLIKNPLNKIGFTNFRAVYRKSWLPWAIKNEPHLKVIFNQAANLRTEDQATNVFKKVLNLSRIPSPNGKSNIQAYIALSPILACLDPRKKFPIINGAFHVKALIKRMDLTKVTPDVHFEVMTRLIHGPIQDAFMLDALGPKALDYVSMPTKMPNVVKQKYKNSTKDAKKYKERDEEEIKGIIKSKEIVYKRIHNKMTNVLKEDYEKKGLIVNEGNGKDCLFDLLVKRYDDKGKDLLIEVKSTIDIGSIRLAVGQLLDYRRQLPRYLVTDMAICLPSQPDKHAKDFLANQGIEIKILKI